MILALENDTRNAGLRTLWFKVQRLVAYNDLFNAKDRYR